MMRQVYSTIVIKESDLKEAYDKKKEQFRQYVETRNIKYIDVQVTASPEDKDDIQKEVEEYTAQLGETSSDYANFIRSTGSTQPVSYTHLDHGWPLLYLCNRSRKEVPVFVSVMLSAYCSCLLYTSRDTC